MKTSSDILAAIRGAHPGVHIQDVPRLALEAYTATKEAERSKGRLEVALQDAEREINRAVKHLAEYGSLQTSVGGEWMGADRVARIQILSQELAAANRMALTLQALAEFAD